MTFSSLSIARRICELGNWQLTNLKLQKILYLTHMVYIGETKQPLIKESFEAWDFGPVEPSLYHSVKFFGNKNIEFIPNSIKEPLENCEITIRKVFDCLKDKTAGQLVQLTHRKNGAWHETYSVDKRGLKIQNEDIISEYERFTK